MVTHAKTPHPRKKRTRAEEPAVEENAVVAGVAPVEALSEPARQEIPSYAEPITVMPVRAEENSELPAPKKPTPAALKRTETLQDRSEQSDEPDFGLGIGDILRSDETLKTRAIRQDREVSRAGSDDSRLSIDSILRGETRKAEPVKAVHKDDDEPVTYMDPKQIFESGRSGVKTAALVVLVLLLFVAAAGGVYMFLAKAGLPSFGSFGKSSSDNSQNQAVKTAAPSVQVPSSVSVTVLVGATAPATPGAKQFIVSRVLESDGKTSGSFPATGTATSKIGKSTGKATITNTTSKSYTFVATTRLLSKEGVLYRMLSASPIPANGSVTVDVRADQPGAEGDLGPTTFVIPGLSPDLQKKITAKSDAAMTGGAGSGKGVAQADIDAAKAALTDKLRKEAVDNFAVMLMTGEKTNADMITSKELAVTVPKVGTPGASFTMTLSLRFRALVVPEKDLSPLLTKAMSGALPASLNAVDYSLGNYLYTVQAYDASAGIAELRVDAPIIRR